MRKRGRCDNEAGWVIILHLNAPQQTTLRTHSYELLEFFRKYFLEEWSIAQDAPGAMRFPKRSPFPATGNCAKLLKFNANFYSHFLGLFGCVAISDDESSDVDAHLPVASWRDDDEVEARPARKAAAAKPATVDVEDDEDEEEDEDDDGGDDVFIVETIKKHMIDEDT
ncbi:hypothetical protein NQ176_g6524 [Zarea fungicola]|uniref:Uncharacterized protein n=1 Tax=Zarea fungicola TaxID=93591 RepID=A0ACC1N3C1_9HYPO|nr:hypothetical protein NQ176_g6524 [Lecanicillium fungicola]